MIPGIDVSHWQNDKSTAQKIDFKKAKAAGAEFVFIKVSERGSIDLDFEYNWQAAKDAGLLRGGYHFLRWNLTGLIQARIFCDIMKDDPGELPPVADYEAPPLSRPGKDPLYPSNSLLDQFLVEVESITNRRPMIYTSFGYWNTHGKMRGTNKFDAKWSYYPLWVAHYTKADKPKIPSPWKDWVFWQYSATGNGPKYGAESKSIDLNWFNGDLIDLYALAEQGETNPPDQPDNPPIPPGANPDLAIINAQLKILKMWAKGIGFKG